MRRNGFIVWGCRFAVSYALMTRANAHTMGTQVGDFYDGMLHPLLSPEHLLVLTALGLLAGQRGGALPRLMMGGVAVGLFTGAGVMLLAPWLVGNGLTVGLLAVMGAVGGLVAGAWRLPRLLIFSAGVAVATGVSALLFVECPAEARPWTYGAGVSLTLLWIPLLISAVAAGMNRGGGWKSLAVRIVGSWIVAIAVMMLAFHS